MERSPQFQSSEWVCTNLGVTKDWFYRNRRRLEAEGFPRRDPILKLWNVADFQAWINSRRKFADEAIMTTESDVEVNFDGL